LETYLEIAESVLRAARRPLTARAIMDAAYRGGIVPAHLYGKAQHKTLQARLSEDILHRKLESRFFRTDPGYFFLSELRSDPEIPDKFKDPFHARRRTRDLGKTSALALDKKYVLDVEALQFSTWQELLKDADRAGALKHVDSRSKDDNLLFVWAFSIVRRNDQLLSYRVGQYRDDRDAFANRQSIGFSDLVGFDDSSLFSDDMGVSECGLNAVLSDLDLSKSAFPNEVVQPSVSFTVIATDQVPEPVVLFVMEWKCPDWFEPTARRLSLNEVRWIDATRRPNDIKDFEPWSAIAFTALVDGAGQGRSDGETNWKWEGCILSI
jgi:hypothetical protein